MNYGKIFVRVAGVSSSSPWLGKGSYLSPEYKRFKPVSSLTNQPIAQPSSVPFEHTVVCRQS